MSEIDPAIDVHASPRGNLRALYTFDAPHRLRAADYLPIPAQQQDEHGSASSSMPRPRQYDYYTILP
jgi:hypothetical protein